MDGGRGGNGGDIVFIPKEDRVVGVVPAGVARVYDIVCAAPHHNFVANGIVVHNSGKTLCALGAAALLGCSTLILVDQGNLLEQWAKAVRCFVDGSGRRLEPGIIREGAMDLSAPFVIGMVQSLAHRQLPEEARRAFGCLIVDECQGVPCATLHGALARFEAMFVLGLSATPDRKDGLTAAIPWLIGPTIAELTRTMEADVQFQHVPYVGLVPKERADGSNYMGKARIAYYGKTDPQLVEKALLEDPARLDTIARAAIDGMRSGRQTLIMAGLKEHVRRLHAAIGARGHGGDVGLYYGDQTDRSAMRAPVVITTFKMSSKGTDFDPPPTLFIPAAPVRDIRQAAGRALQPQVPHRTLIWDLVDGHPALIKWAHARHAYYQERRFNVVNEVCPAGWPPVDRRLEEVDAS